MLRSTETFGLSDARQLAMYARTAGIGMLAIWSIGEGGTGKPRR